VTRYKEESEMLTILKQMRVEIHEIRDNQFTPLIAIDEKRAAKALGVCSMTVKRLGIRGLIKRVPHIGKRLYTVKSIQEFVNQED